MWCSVHMVVRVHVVQQCALTGQLDDLIGTCYSWSERGDKVIDLSAAAGQVLLEHYTHSPPGRCCCLKTLDW